MDRFASLAMTALVDAVWLGAALTSRARDPLVVLRLVTSVANHLLSGTPNRFGLIGRAFRGILDKMTGGGGCVRPSLLLNQYADLTLGEAAPIRANTAAHRVAARPKCEQKNRRQ